MISTLRRMLDEHEISSCELTELYLERIKDANEYNCYITVCAEEAMRQAKLAQERIDRSEAAPLTGIPLSLKDNICTKGIKTTCASRMLENFVPYYDSFAVKRLKDQNAVILGKTNMDEFAMGSSSQTSFFGGVKNPLNTAYVPGGSSGGAAAATALGLCAAALGSDTGGSVRQPAAFCGVTGLKPTYGSVSRNGLVAFASSLDQIGFIAENAQDAYTVFDAVAGLDPLDSTSKIRQDHPCRKKFRIGLPEQLFKSPALDNDIGRAVLEAARIYEQQGMELVNVSFPSLQHALAAYYIISSAEASSNLARYDGIRYGFSGNKSGDFTKYISHIRSCAFGREVKRRIMLGNYVLSSKYYDQYYRHALNIRTAVCRDYGEMFSQCDIILTPTCPSPPFKTTDWEKSPISTYIWDMYTVPASIAGLPSLSIPCGYGANGMPISMSLTGRPFSEKQLCLAAELFEKVTKGDR